MTDADSDVDGEDTDTAADTDVTREDTDVSADDNQLECPYDGCAAGPWPDTYGATGGRRERFVHAYDEHGDARGSPARKVMNADDGRES